MPRRKRKYEEYITVGFDDTGRRKRKYIGADSNAEFERLKKAAIIEAERIRNPTEVTVGEYADKWYRIYKANSSIQTQNEYKYAKDKLYPIRLMPLKDVTTSDLQEIINDHADHPRSCQQLKSTMCQIWKQAIKDGIIYPVNIAEDLALPQYVCKERRFITDAEMDKIIQGNYNDQDRLYLDMLRNTGMRPSEALALQWTDIDGQKITVRRSFQFNGNWPVVKTTKTGKIRTIPINAEFATRLSNLPHIGVFVFTYNNGHPISKSVYRKMAGRILREINRVLGGTEKLSLLDGMTMYSFRHTFATNLYYNAVKPGIISAKQAARIMGHQEDIFIKRYTHLDESKEKMDELMDALWNQKKSEKDAERVQGDQRETQKTG